MLGAAVSAPILRITPIHDNIAQSKNFFRPQIIILFDGSRLGYLYPNVFFCYSHMSVKFSDLGLHNTLRAFFFWVIYQIRSIWRKGRLWVFSKTPNSNTLSKLRWYHFWCLQDIFLHEIWA